MLYHTQILPIHPSIHDCFWNPFVTSIFPHPSLFLHAFMVFPPSSLPYSLPPFPTLLYVTLHLPVFVHLSFQEFIWRKCCFPNLITPQPTSAVSLTMHFQFICNSAYCILVYCNWRNVVNFGKYTDLLQCWELAEEMNTTVMSVGHSKQ